MAKLKIYLIIQDEVSGYDTYDSCVVVAKSKNEAREILPCDSGWCRGRTWASHAYDVKVRYLGECHYPYKEGDVIIASFNAG